MVKHTEIAKNKTHYLRDWPGLVTPLIENLHSDRFGDAFFDSINQFVPIDSAIIMLFRVDREPKVLVDRLHPSENSSFYDVYLGGAYLLSPLYRQLPSLRSGFYRLAAFKQTNEAYQDFNLAYFNQSGLSDDANFVHKIDRETALIASFGRQQLKTVFSDTELHQLHIAEPVYRAAMAKNWDQSFLEKTGVLNDSAEAHIRLKASLARFARSILTERERAVLGLMIEGESSKSSANRLNISSETERGHRKNIYAKLKVTSQTQLFSLIFSVMSRVGLEDVDDPYMAYLEIAGR